MVPVWQGMVILTPESESSEFSALKNGPIFRIWGQNKKTAFLPEKNLFGHFTDGFYYIAMAVFGLNLRDLSQSFGIWCENPISAVLPMADWPRLKKAKKIQKKPFLGVFLI